MNKKKVEKKKIKKSNKAKKRLKRLFSTMLIRTVGELAVIFGTLLMLSILLIKRFGPRPFLSIENPIDTTGINFWSAIVVGLFITIFGLVLLCRVNYIAFKQWIIKKKQAKQKKEAKKESPVRTMEQEIEEEDEPEEKDEPEKEEKQDEELKEIENCPVCGTEVSPYDDSCPLCDEPLQSFKEN